MRRPKRSGVAIALLVLVFLAGFGLAKVLDRAAATGSVRGQADRYQQILSDLERAYYKPLDVAKLGQRGIDSLLASLHDPYTVYLSPQAARQFGAPAVRNASSASPAAWRRMAGLAIVTSWSSSERTLAAAAALRASPTPQTCRPVIRATRQTWAGVCGG
jgi:C-terminal processing protease CtpA/Prc